MSTAVTPSYYRMDRAYSLRVFGRLACVAAALVVVAAVLLTIGGGGWLDVLGDVVGGFGLMIVAAGLVAVAVPPIVLRVDQVGYRRGRLGGTGIRSAEWRQVADVHTQEIAAAPGHPALVLHLDSGRTTRIPLSLVPRRSAELEHDVSERLNAAHGYRRWETSQESPRTSAD